MIIIDKERGKEQKRKNISKNFKKALDKSFQICYNIMRCDGASPSGKATDSDSVIT